MLLIVNICLNVIWLTTRHGLNDLGSFLHSGAAYHQHVNPYSYQSWLLPHPISREGLNLNPPVSVYLFDHLSRLPSSFVENLFVIGSIAMLTVAVAADLHRVEARRRRKCELLGGWPPVAAREAAEEPPQHPDVH